MSFVIINVFSSSLQSKRLTTEHPISSVSAYTATYVEAQHYEAEDGSQNKQQKGVYLGYHPEWEYCLKRSRWNQQRNNKSKQKSYNFFMKHGRNSTLILKIILWIAIYLLSNSVYKLVLQYSTTFTVTFVKCLNVDYSVTFLWYLTSMTHIVLST